MRAVDRVMRAYTRTHKLTDEQHQQVRDELSKFIRELMLVGLPTDEAEKGATGSSERANRRGDVKPLTLLSADWA